ncbi:hypothetical protein [Actinotalea fermentans]|uniref:NERD domain-containing protein n=1 Tax=Actinotalea fermentans TaxID=43671 RepID=A0A511YZ97_9CELL|nr:hypothetical protein [Actinotalea fermentans]GEN80456.1 hypothetical protein AFE02nite_21900 [Actinotalea fermentans]
MSITHHAGAPSTLGSVEPATEGHGRRLAPEQLAAVDAEQRAHLSFAQSPDAPEGEHLVRRSIELLAPYGWHHLRMVTWQQATPGTVAHLVVGPGGVVVVDERIWTGAVSVEAGVLRHGGYRCEREVDALGDAVAALSAILPPQYRTSVSGVLCVTPRDMPAQRLDGIHLVGRLHLGGLLAGLEERLSPVEVQDAARALTLAFDGPAPAPAPTPGPLPAVPSQRPSPEAMHLPAESPAPAAYFARSQGATADAAPPAAPPTTPWRAVAGRVAVAVLVGVLTFQNSQAITTAVSEWLGGDTTSVVAAEG